MTVFYSDVEEPLSKYSPVMLHLSLATGIFNENPNHCCQTVIRKSLVPSGAHEGSLGRGVLEISLKP